MELHIIFNILWSTFSMKKDFVSKESGIIFSKKKKSTADALLNIICLLIWYSTSI